MGHTTTAVLTTTLATSAMLFTSDAAQAGIVASWGTPTAINSNDDIINPGNILQAINLGNAASNVSVTTSAGSVDFVPSGGLVVGSGIGNFANDRFFEDNNPAAGSVTGGVGDDPDQAPDGSDLHLVLDSFTDNQPFYIEFSGLAPGTYYVQVFQSDDRSNRNVNWNILTNPGELGETPHAPLSFSSNKDLFRSSYAIATVTLTAGTDSFAFAREDAGALPVNAVVLSQVPEPGSLALMGLDGLVMLRRR